MEISMNTKVLNNFLAEAKRRNTPMHIFITNGFQMKAKIVRFDDSALLVESDGKQYLIYRHAVSTVAPITEGPNLNNGYSGYNAL